MKDLLKIGFTLLFLLFSSLVSANKVIPDLVTKSGTIRTAVIPVQFSDISFKYGRTDLVLQESFNANHNSVSEYFSDNFPYFQLFNFEILPIVTLDKSAAYYGGNNAFSNDSHIEELFIDVCTASVNKGINFSHFDLDSDNNIDLVFIVFAGKNEADGGSSDAIWPMCTDLSNLKATFSGKKLQDVICYSELNGIGEFAGVGTICHELCHVFGMPDLYDVNGNVEGLANPLFGSICLMDKGNFNNNGRTPPYLGALERDALGILHTIEVKAGESYLLSPIHQSNIALKIPTNNRDEYFLIEYRDGGTWDTFIGGSGLLVYHVDKSWNQAGSMTAYERWKYNAVNANSAHPCAVLVDILHTGNIKDIFYPGQSDVINLLSNENDALRLWNGNGVGLGIKNVSFGPANTINLTIVEDPYWTLPTINEVHLTVNQRDALVEWDNDAVNGASWVMRWGSSRSIYMETIYLKGKSHNFTNLLAGETYICDIFALKDGMEGKKYHFEFQTIPELTNYPLIAFVNNPYVIGQSLRLNIINVKSAPLEQKWYYDEIEVKDEELYFTKKGLHKLRVDFTLDGKAYESLEKVIIVE